MKQCARYLALYIIPEQHLVKLPEWLTAIKKCIERSGSEATLALKLLALIWICFGAQVDLFPGVSEILRDHITNGSEDIKVGALECLSLVFLVEKIDDHIAEQYLDFTMNIFQNESTPTSVMSSALYAFGLIYHISEERPRQKQFNE